MSDTLQKIKLGRIFSLVKVPTDACKAFSVGGAWHVALTHEGTESESLIIFVREKVGLVKTEKMLA